MASAPGSVSNAPLPTSASSGPSPSNPAVPLLLFHNVNEMFTCGITSVDWNYSGPAESIALNITNVDVPQPAPPSSSSTGISPSPVGPGGAQPLRKRQFSGYGGSYLPTVVEAVATDIDPNVGNWTWQAVNVPQGWYKMVAVIPGAVAESSQFFVQNGTEQSCIRNFSADSAGSTPSSSSTSSAISTPASSFTAPPVLSGSSHSHAGAIAGGVVGGIAFLAAVIGALLFWFCRRRPVHTRAHAQEAGIGSGGKWSGLGSVTSAAIRKARRQTSDSAQPAISRNGRSQSSSVGVDTDAAHTPIGSDEELSSVAHEKALAHGPTNALENVAPTFVPYTTPRPQKRISSSSSVSNFGATYRAHGGSQRALSSPDAPGAQSFDSTRRPSSYAPAMPPSAAFPRGEMIPLERTATNNAARRKPVPKYDNAESTTPPESALGNLHRAASSSLTTLESFHGLQHQSSFGNMRPMHVLEADMPLPRRD